MGNPRGGPAESVSDFAYFAEEANMVLRLYEATTAPEGPDCEYLRKQIRVPEIAAIQSSLLALDYVAETVHLRVTGECYPRLYRQRDGTFRRGWGFKSLLGAMWLQMMWLMSASDEDIHRCPWCRKTVRFEPSPDQPQIDPGLKKFAHKNHKTREDKIYCDDLCKAKWNYHYGEGKSSKHARKRERERRKADDD